jgi:hypothetical protein
MTNTFVHWGTARSWEIVVIQWRWISSLRNNIIVNYFINLLSGHTRGNHFMTCVNCSSSNQANLSNCNNFLVSMNWRCFVPQLLKRGIWLSRFSVVWTLDIVRDRPFTSEWIWEWSKRTSELKSTFDSFISFFVRKFVHSPKFFKANLTAEKCWFEL